MGSIVVEHRSGRRLRLALASILFAAVPAQAQEKDPDARAIEMIEEAKAYYGTGRPLRGCQTTAAADEIVVCALPQPDVRYREMAPFLRQEAKMIALGAPPVGGGFGVSATMRGCILQACPKEILIIDVKAIPEPAPGSDAYLIARGDAPAR
jgi:hypothetical protein